MDMPEVSIVRATRRASRWLAASMLALATAGCAGLEPADELGAGVERLADELVRSARERADLRQTRVWVAGIHETRSETKRTSVGEVPDDLIAVRLEREFVIALATRMNVLAPELVDGGLASPAGASRDEQAASGATHVLVGDYVRQRDVLQVTVQLIEADSRLIVAAARGAVPLTEVGLASSQRIVRRPTTWGRVSESSVQAPAPGASAAPAPAEAVKATPVTAPSRATVARPVKAAPVPAPSAKAHVKCEAAPKPAKPAAAAQPPAPVPASAAPAAVEDFETWRKRRLDAHDTVSGLSPAALEAEAHARAAAATRARGNQLANLPEESAEPFPWRKNPWLSRLLGVPPGVHIAPR